MKNKIRPRKEIEDKLKEILKKHELKQKGKGPFQKTKINPRDHSKIMALEWVLKIKDNLL